jgi:uncharacterized damage-inducible protein DinB
MSEEFDRDLARCCAELDTARRELLSIVTALSDDDLEGGRRGEWTVRRILEHVIQSEWLYSRLLTHLRGLPVQGDAIEAKPNSAADALERLAASRAALNSAFDGVDEETFYRLAQLGPEEYSVISLLENEANHEREHAAQITRTVHG